MYLQNCKKNGGRYWYIPKNCNNFDKGSKMQKTITSIYTVVHWKTVYTDIWQ